MSVVKVLLSYRLTLVPPPFFSSKETQRNILFFLFLLWLFKGFVKNHRNKRVLVSPLNELIFCTYIYFFLVVTFQIVFILRLRF